MSLLVKPSARVFIYSEAIDMRAGFRKLRALRRRVLERKVSHPLRPFGHAPAPTPAPDIFSRLRAGHPRAEISRNSAGDNRYDS